MLSFFTDKHFWIAIIAAVLVWGLAYFLVDGLIVKRSFNPFYVIILYPILEELAFRGFIQDIIGQRLRNNLIAKLSTANALTSILFAATHLLYQAPFWALLILIPSLIFGYFKDRTGSTIPSIVLHMFYNTGFVVLFTA